MTLIIDTTRISQFQEYFAARALCEAGTVLSGSPPWKWPVWWSNALSLGAEMGDDPAAPKKEKGDVNAFCKCISLSSLARELKKHVRGPRWPAGCDAGDW